MEQNNDFFSDNIPPTPKSIPIQDLRKIADVVLNELDWKNNELHLNMACFFVAMYFDFGRPGETIEKTVMGQYKKMIYKGQNGFNIEYFCKSYNKEKVLLIT